MPDRFVSDRLQSEELDEVLQMSLEDARPPRSNTNAGPSRAGQSSFARGRNQPSALDTEIDDVRTQIAKLQDLLSSLLSQKRAEQLQYAAEYEQEPDPNDGRVPTIDYTAGDFDWSAPLKAKMKTVFGIKKFRHCQEGVCNANMDGRDIVCVMPTGGGKSLTYQLPALLTPGCTLVVSPLIALITDQVLHLREAGVEVAMLTSATAKQEVDRVVSKLKAMAARSGNMPGDGETDIKLCYVTPEKIAKSKAFEVLLGKLAKAHKLARIVIDEAHCVSQMGHDFRPDYRKLSKLRQLFPSVPILALSATCPPKVRTDLLKILGMRSIVDGSRASPNGTVYFSSPLYRKNLHYSVVPKPSSAEATIQTMTDYIMQYHKNDSGIIYCMSKKEAEDVAAGIKKASGGKIGTGVYHAGVGDEWKEGLHLKWRSGDVKVICATIAFGLGIDKGDVRFVLHHTVSKSLDGFYQESGRAGRDGKDADCVLYYRTNDATRITSLVYEDPTGRDKVLDMIRFAHDLRECRKIQFAKYFSASSNMSMQSWSTADADVMTRCGHCDNCARPPEDVEERDAKLDAWKMLKICEAAQSEGGRMTLTQFGDLTRGLGGGKLGAGGGRRKDSQVTISVEDVAGGKVSLNRADTERLITELLLSNYLTTSMTANAYSVNVYIVPGPQADRLTRLTLDEVQQGKGPALTCFFIATKKPAKKARTKSATGGRKASASSEAATQGDRDIRSFARGSAGNAASSARVATKPAKKRKRQAEVSSEDEAEAGEDDAHDDPSDGAEELGGEVAGSSSEEDGGGDWDIVVSARSRQKRRKVGGRVVAQDDVIELSD